MTVLLDAAGRRRSPVTMPGYHAGRPPGNKGTSGALGLVLSSDEVSRDGGCCSPR
jgi:hypothetical protein